MKAQSAAVPWRFRPDGAVEVLVITSRETRRWVIPKGWPMAGLDLAASAAQEAFEEAGVRGETGDLAGTFDYAKRRKDGRMESVRVSVFPMRVTEELADWPERTQRERLWTSPAKAADLVHERQLKAILLALRP